MMHGVFLTLEVTSTPFTFLVRPGKLSSDRSQKNDEGKKIPCTLKLLEVYLYCRRSAVLVIQNLFSCFESARNDVLI